MIISQIFLPISLAIIMFGMGLTLVVGDFGRIFTYPKAVLVGLCNQLVFLPLIGFSIISPEELPEVLFLGFAIRPRIPANCLI